MALDMTVRPLLGNERTRSGKQTWVVEWDDAEGERRQLLVGTRSEVLLRLRPHRVRFERRPWLGGAAPKCRACGGTGRWWGRDEPCPCPAGDPGRRSASVSP